MMAVDHREVAVTNTPRRAGAWVVTLTWGAAVCAMHFGGLKYDIYTSVWWWDLATHSMSGAGVAALFYLFFTDRLSTTFGRLFVMPAFVLGVGAGFEVYEFVFKDFWYGWSRSYYLQDTVVDLGMDVLGALAVVAFLRVNGLLDRRVGTTTEGDVDRPTSADESTGD